MNEEALCNSSFLYVSGSTGLKMALPDFLSGRSKTRERKGLAQVSSSGTLLLTLLGFLGTALEEKIPGHVLPGI